MKKQKRDLQERAFQRGYRAGLTGRPLASCPHPQGEMRRGWINGWREGRGDAWDGFGVAPGLQKLALR